MSPLGWMEQITRFAVIHGASRRALAALSTLSVADYFLPALPTQASVIALGILQPQRAVLIALAFAIAASLGASLLALMLVTVSGYASAFGTGHFGEHWIFIQTQVLEYGVWAVLIASALPSPPRLLTAAAILAGTSIGLVVAAVFIGRLIWLSFFLSLLIRAPRVLAEMPVIGSMLKRFHRYRAEVLEEAQLSQRA